MAKLYMTPAGGQGKRVEAEIKTKSANGGRKLTMRRIQQPQRTQTSGATSILQASDITKQDQLRNEAARRQTEDKKKQTKASTPVSDSPLLAPLARNGVASSYGAASGLSKTTLNEIANREKTKVFGPSPILLGKKEAPSSYAAISGVKGATPSTPATPYAAGQQAGIVKAPERTTKPKTEKPAKEAAAPAWMGLLGQSAAELEQRHKTAMAERDALSKQVEQEATPAPNSTYAASAGRYKPKEANPISSSAAASGGWVSQEDKLLAPLRMAVSRKQDEVNDLAAAHYHRKNQEQFAKLETDAAAKISYTSAKELTADLDALSKALSAPSSYNGHDTRFNAAGEALAKKYGTYDLQTLQRALTAQKAKLVADLAAKGYDFETMAGYDRMLAQQETYAKTQEKWQKDAEEHPVASSGVSVFLSPLQGFDAIRTWGNGVGHSNADDLGSYVPANVYDMYATNAVQAIRGTVSKQIEENTDWELFGQNVASFLYNTGMSMADSALQVSTLGSGATFVMGLSSAANTTKEIIERGGSNEQAFWGGLAAGTAEMVFEKFSVESILNLDFGDGWKDAIKALFAQGGVEASEEMLTEVANILSDAMVMGDRSGLAASIRAYEEQGLTRQEAGLRATLDSIGQVSLAGAAGFLSGIGMAGGKLALQKGGNAVYDHFTRRQQRQTAENVTGAGVDSRLGTDVAVDTPTAQNPVEGAKNATTEGAGGNVRLTETDTAEYMATGKKKSVRDAKAAEVERGGKVVLTTAQETQEFIGDAIRGVAGQTTKAYGKVGTEMAGEIRAVSGSDIDVTGWFLELVPDDLRHAFEQHTKAKRDGNIDLTEQDFLNIPDYIDSYDDILEVRTFKGGDREVVVGKKINGYSVIVELMSNNRKSLHFKNMWGLDTQTYESRYGKRSTVSHPDRSSVSANDPTEVYRDASSIDSIPQTAQDVNPETGDGGYWDSLMETAERGEVVNQAEAETEEEINARIQGAMSEWMRSLNQINTQAEVLADLPEEHRGMGQRVKDVADSAYRQFVDSGAEIEKMGKELGDKTLYPYYNAARQSTSAASYMLQKGGAQMSVAGEVVGKSLADIFQPIRDKGEQYYIEFQEYLYHLHNIDRMSRDNSVNISEARRQLNEFDEMMAQTRPDLASMPESDLVRDAAMGDMAAQQRLELLNAYNEAKAIRNKPVFDQEVGAEQSRKVAEQLLANHPEFQELAGEVYQYSNNLLQYRVDSGLVTQEFADYLRKVYPHYVPTYRVTEGTSAGGKRKGARVGKTVSRATGGNSDLMPLHMALARQTAQVVRNGTLNRLGQRLLLNYDQAPGKGSKYVYKVQEATQGLHEDTFDLLEDPTPERENTFTIYKDGKALNLSLNKGMSQAIDALLPKSSGWKSEDSYKLPAKATTLFKELTTGKNPGFLVRNFFRDFQEGVVYSESTLRWLKNFPKAYKGIVKNSTDWQLFQANGGVYSSVFDYQKGYRLEDGGKNVVQRFLGKVEAANSVIEMAPRFAEFLSYLEKHGRSQDSIIEAVNRAAEITTNFGKGGEAGKFLNRTFVPFLNPGIQGANKMLKTALGRNGAKACMKLWILGAGVLGLGVRALNDLLNGDDEDYENVRDNAKDTNWLIPIGDGKYIKIPMGRDASSLGIIASRLIGMAHGDKVDWGDAASTIINQSAPSNPLKTNILAAWLDADLLDAESPGKTWYGGDIESKRLQNLAPGQRFDEDTDYFSKWLGGVLNVSPKKINYILDQYSGVVGEYVLPLITPSKNKSIVSTFTSNFVLDGVTQNSLSSDFYSTSDKIKYAKNGGDGSMAVVSRFWGRQSDAVSDLNAALRELENDTTIPNKEKQEKIREAKAVIGGVQKNALEVLEEYKAAARKYYTGDSETEIKRAYREANREVFGAEYALQVYDKKIYERAVATKKAGVDFDTYYDAYFATRGTDGKEMKDNQKRNILKGMNVSDEVKIALYTDLVTDGRDDDIQATQAAGLPFNKFLEAQNQHSEINAKKGLTNNTKQAEFARWIDSQLLTVKQQTALKEAFGFYGMVRAGESKYETLTQAGWDSDEAWEVSKKLDMLKPQPGKETVTSTQKSRVIVDNVSDNTKRLSALAEFVDEGTYNKLEIAYQHGVDPKVFVFYKEQVESIRAQTGKDNLSQEQTAALLRRFAGISDRERAALWQLQNTSWKPLSNPFDRNVGQKVYAVYQKRKGK